MSAVDAPSLLRHHSRLLRNNSAPGHWLKLRCATTCGLRASPPGVGATLAGDRIGDGPTTKLCTPARNSSLSLLAKPSHRPSNVTPARRRGESPTGSACLPRSLFWGGRMALAQPPGQSDDPGRSSESPQAASCGGTTSTSRYASLHQRKSPSHLDRCTVRLERQRLLSALEDMARRS